MAEKTFTRLTNVLGNDLIILKWEGVANGDTLQPAKVPAYNDKVIAVHGIFGSGGSISLYGSNIESDEAVDPTTSASSWIPLKDAQGNTMTYTSKDGEAINQNFFMIGGKVTAGDGTTSLTVTLVCKRS